MKVFLTIFGLSIWFRVAVANSRVIQADFEQKEADKAEKSEQDKPFRQTSQAPPTRGNIMTKLKRHLLEGEKGSADEAAIRAIVQNVLPNVKIDDSTFLTFLTNAKKLLSIKKADTVNQEELSLYQNVPQLLNDSPRPATITGYADSQGAASENQKNVHKTDFPTDNNFLDDSNYFDSDLNSNWRENRIFNERETSNKKEKLNKLEESRNIGKTEHQVQQIPARDTDIREQTSQKNHTWVEVNKIEMTTVTSDSPPAAMVIIGTPPGLEGGRDEKKGQSRSEISITETSKAETVQPLINSEKPNISLSEQVKEKLESVSGRGSLNKWYKPCVSRKSPRSLLAMDEVGELGVDRRNASLTERLSFIKGWTARARKEVSNFCENFAKLRFNDSHYTSDLGVLTLKGIPHPPTFAYSSFIGEAVHSTPLLRQAYMSMTREAVFIQQLRLDELVHETSNTTTTQIGQQALAVEKTCVYELLCLLRLTLHDFGIDVDRDATIDIVRQDYKMVENRSIRIIRDYIILREFEKLLDQLFVQFTVLQKIRQQQGNGR